MYTRRYIIYNDNEVYYGCMRHKETIQRVNSTPAPFTSARLKVRVRSELRDKVGCLT